MILSLVKIFLPAALAFIAGIALTPVMTHYFYKYKMWKKKPRLESDTMSENFIKIHNSSEETSTPRAGGMIIWISVILISGLIYLLSDFFASGIFDKLNFLSRNQTLVPMAALLLGSLIGLIDDFLQIAGKGSYAEDAVGYRRIKIISIILIGLLISLWFYFKLGMTSISIPFDGRLELGIWFIPFFVFVMLATFSTSVIDGVDGLAGGVMATVFASMATIAFFHDQLDIAAFCAVITGAILAFLWFNIPPARFYMGETGMLGLTVTLAVVAFLTDSVLLLPLIALPLAATAFSSFIQIVSKKIFGPVRGKIFRVAPLHHHFEAIGWSRAKITMRYWIISVVVGIIGVIITVIS